MTRKYAAISWRMSASLTVLSSKPGVSISLALRPSSRKGDVISTAEVQDMRSAPILKFAPLAALTNWEMLEEPSGTHCTYCGLSGARRSHYTDDTLSVSFFIQNLVQWRTR